MLEPDRSGDLEAVRAVEAQIEAVDERIEQECRQQADDGQEQREVERALPAPGCDHGECRAQSIRRNDTRSCRQPDSVMAPSRRCPRPVSGATDRPPLQAQTRPMDSRRGARITVFGLAVALAIGGCGSRHEPFPISADGVIRNRRWLGTASLKSLPRSNPRSCRLSVTAAKGVSSGARTESS